MMPDLFDTPVLPGLTYQPDIVDAAEERALIAAIDALPLAPFRFQRWEGKRLTFSFGMNYDFTGGGMIPAPPMPDWLEPLRARAAKVAGVARQALVQALLLRYDPGAGIGWHRDRPVFGAVAGVSLGAPATLRFRRRRSEGGFGRAILPLEPRSLYHLTGDARSAWEHGIAAGDRTRWSLTFRTLARG